MVASLAQWIRLCLPSCRPRFESQAYHLCIYHLKYLCYICHVKRMKKQKEAGFGPFKKIQISTIFRDLFSIIWHDHFRSIDTS